MNTESPTPYAEAVRLETRARTIAAIAALLPNTLGTLADKLLVAIAHPLVSGLGDQAMLQLVLLFCGGMIYFALSGRASRKLIQPLRAELESVRTDSAELQKEVESLQTECARLKSQIPSPSRNDLSPDGQRLLIALIERTNKHLPCLAVGMEGFTPTAFTAAQSEIQQRGFISIPESSDFGSFPQMYLQPPGIKYAQQHQLV